MCESTFSALTSLNQHKKAMHCKAEDLPTLDCKMCGLAFKTKQEYRMHVIRKHAPKSFQCEKCEYKAVTAFMVRKTFYIEFHNFMFTFMYDIHNKITIIH